MAETAIRERPILFSAEMVRAILDGRKTQTRRVVKPQPENVPSFAVPEINAHGYLNWHWPTSFGNAPNFRTNGTPRHAYGQPGDRLIPLCTWSVLSKYDSLKPTDLPSHVSIWSPWCDSTKPGCYGKLRPGRFMPSFLRGRLPRLENTDVRVERVQSITNDNAYAEGICFHYPTGNPDVIRHAVYGTKPTLKDPSNAKDAFRLLWDSINEKRGYSWESNPWVWCISFKRVEE